MPQKSIDRLLKKSEGHFMKVTTKITGATKEKFVKNCVKRDGLEVDIARGVMDVYYAVVEVIPNYEYMDAVEIKRYIIDRIKFNP